MGTKYETVDEYFAACTDVGRERLFAIRDTVLDAVPGAGMRISYQIPTFTWNGKTLVYMAAWAHHVSMYPIPHDDAALRERLAPYIASKGTLKFPYSKPLPLDIVRDVTTAMRHEVDGD